MARTGTDTLIATLRGFCNLGTDDYTLGTSTFWSDDNIQTTLDRHRTTVVREELTEITNLTSGGTVEYKEFRSGYGNFEETTGGTTIFWIENSEGGDLGTSLYSVDYALGIVTFDADQAGSSRYLNGRSYDLNMAASDIWRMKMGAYAEAVNFKTDNMSVDRGKLIDHCTQMSNFYASQGKSKTLDITRMDSY